MSLRKMKLACVVAAISLTAIAYASFPGRGAYLLAGAMWITLLGIFLSTESASGTVLLSTVLYTIPYAIVFSQFLPIAFPETYRELSITISASPYFSSPLPVLGLMTLSILTEYTESAERWEAALNELGWRGTGQKLLTYGVPTILAALALSVLMLQLGKKLHPSPLGAAVPVIILIIGLAVAYSSSEAGDYRRAIVAVELPPLNGELHVEDVTGRKVVPLSRSATFEWDTLRVEVETTGRPARVVLKTEDGEKVLSPLLESVDNKTLFLLYVLRDGRRKLRGGEEG